MSWKKLCKIKREGKTGTGRSQTIGTNCQVGFAFERLTSGCLGGRKMAADICGKVRTWRHGLEYIEGVVLQSWIYSAEDSIWRG